MKRPAKVKRGRAIKTVTLSNIARPSSAKMKPLSSHAAPHKKRGEHKEPKAKGKTASTPRAARAPRGHKHEGKVRTAKDTNIEKKASKPRNEPASPKKPKWFS